MVSLSSGSSAIVSIIFISDGINEVKLLGENSSLSVPSLAACSLQFSNSKLFRCTNRQSCSIRSLMTTMNVSHVNKAFVCTQKLIILLSKLAFYDI